MLQRRRGGWPKDTTVRTLQIDCMICGRHTHNNDNKDDKDIMKNQGFYAFYCTPCAVYDMAEDLEEGSGVNI